MAPNLPPTVLIPLLEQRCGNCACWRELSTLEGECRRRAPLPLALAVQPGTVTGCVWPRTGPDDWCAEWMTRPLRQVGERHG